MSEWVGRICFVICFAACAAVAPARADETPRTGVIDEVGVVSAKASGDINRWLLELEQKTGAQLKVWVIATTGGRDPYTLAIETARKWRLGQAEKDNGCLVLIAVNDRKWRFVTGEGVEGALPDIYCDTVAQKYFVPYFRKGDYSQGILLGAAALAQGIAKDAGVELTGMPSVSARPGRHRRSHPAGLFGSCFIIFLAFVIISIASAANRRGRHRRRGWSGGDLVAGMILGSLLRGGGRGRSSWGGGFGGGGFGGGFGGGGGGSFGGGGAGGGW